MTMTPIAQRETDSVTRSQTPSQRSSSPGMSRLATARLRLSTSHRKKRQMKRIVNPARKTSKKSPAIPRTAEIASGTDADVLCAPSCALPPIPVSPSHESSSEERSWSIVWGSSWRKSLTDPPTGTRGRLLDHEPHRELEDKAEEDADEDDQEDAADRGEGEYEPDRGGDDEDRPHREQELDAPGVTVRHCADPIPLHGGQV